MALGLSENLDRLLGVKGGGLSGTGINPHNLEKIGLHDGWEMETLEQLISLNEEGADKIIDRNTKMAEGRTQAERVLESYEHLIEAEQKLVNRLKNVQKKLAKLEMSREEAHSQWLTLKHELNVVRRRTSFQHAADVENLNVAYAKFQRGYQEKLNRITDTSRNGTERGSTVLNNRLPIPVAR